MPQTNFFINETPEFGQCSDDDEDDDEEEDEDEEMDEGEEDIDLDPDMAYLAGLQSIDTDLTRFIGGPAGTGTSTPLLLNDAMLGSAMWPSTGTQHTMGKPVTTTVSAGQLQQQQQQQAQQQQCTGSSAGYVSDRTKLNLNLKLQQKQQQMQQRGQPPATSIRSANSQSASQQKPSQAFNANFQGPKQTTTGKTANHPKAITTPLVKNVNSKRLTSSSKSSGKSTAASTSNLNSNCSPLVLNASTGISTMNSANSSFVNFDPASFLDSCFNTGNVSPESTSLLDGHSSLDQMLMNNSELLLLNQPNSALGQTMTTEQLMMMIGSQTPISHGGQYSAPTSKAVSSGSNSGGSSRSTSKNSNNRQPVSSQIFAGTRTPTSIMHHTNSSSFSSNSGKHSNAGSVQLHFSSTHAGNGSCSSNNSNSASLCPMTTSTVSTLSNHKQAQSVAQSKAANLNAIINNLASANNGAASVGAGAGNQNSGGGSLDGSSSTQQHAAQQLFSGSGNISLLTVTIVPFVTVNCIFNLCHSGELHLLHKHAHLIHNCFSTISSCCFPAGPTSLGDFACQQRRLHEHCFNATLLLSAWHQRRRRRPLWRGPSDNTAATCKPAHCFRTAKYSAASGQWSSLSRGTSRSAAHLQCLQSLHLPIIGYKCQPGPTV